MCWKRRRLLHHTALNRGAGLWLLGKYFLWGSPLGLGPSWKFRERGNPIPRLVGAADAVIGIPVFLLSTTRPIFRDGDAKARAERRRLRAPAVFSVSNF